MPHPYIGVMYRAKDYGHALLGSLAVLADEPPLDGGTVHMHNDCWDVGTFSIHNLKLNKNAEGRAKIPARLVCALRHSANPSEDRRTKEKETNYEYDLVDRVT